jgi:hypothetical protein
MSENGQNTDSQESSASLRYVVARAMVKAGPKLLLPVYYHVALVPSPTYAEQIAQAVKAQFSTLEASVLTVKAYEALIKQNGYTPEPLTEQEDFQGFKIPEKTSGGPRVTKIDGPANLVESKFAITGVAWLVFIAWPGKKVLWRQGTRYYPKDGTVDIGGKQYTREQAVAAGKKWPTHAVSDPLQVFPEAVKLAWRTLNTEGFHPTRDQPWEKWVVLVARTPELATAAALGLKPGQFRPGRVVAVDTKGGKDVWAFGVNDQAELDSLLTYSSNLKAEARGDTVPNGRDGNGDLSKEAYESKIREFRKHTVERGCTPEEADTFKRKEEDLVKKYGPRYGVPK